MEELKMISSSISNLEYDAENIENNCYVEHNISDHTLRIIEKIENGEEIE